MSKEKDLGHSVDGTVVLSLANLLYDEGRSTEQIAIRLDRLRFRRIAVTPLFIAVAATLCSLFAYMIVRSESVGLDMLLEIFMTVVTVLIFYTTLHLFRSSTIQVRKLECELHTALETLQRVVEKVAQFEEYRQLPPLEKFVIELRLAAADAILRSASARLSNYRKANARGQGGRA